MSFYQVIDEVEIIKIGIIKSFQRSSYGSLLIDELKKLDVKKIFLEVSVLKIKKQLIFMLKMVFKKLALEKDIIKLKAIE